MTDTLALENLYNLVSARFTAEATGAANLFGWRKSAQQIPGAKVVWIPGDPTGSLGETLAARQPGRNPRPLATLDELFYVEVTGAAVAGTPEDELLQYKATRLLYDAWYRAVHLAAHGTVRVRSATWVVDKKERRARTSIRAVCTIQAMIPDLVVELAPVDTQARIEIDELDESDIVETATPTPHEVLGSNLAVWLESRSGTGAGPNVTTWVNRLANGDAIQGANTQPPQLVGAAFGNAPAVSFQGSDAGLILTLGAPFAIGDRPYVWTRAKLNRLVHTPGDSQPCWLLGTSPAFTDSMVFAAEATGTFDANGYWDYEAFTSGSSNDTFEQLTELDLLPHTFQCACQQAGALVVDGRVTDAPSPIAALGSACDTVWISNNEQAGALPGVSEGFWDIGVIVMSYTQPTALQIETLAKYCDNYGANP